MARFMDTKLFIEKAKQKHGNTYDYTSTVFVRSNQKVSYICKVHGVVEQTPNAHLAGKGCKFCKQQSYAYSTEEMILKFKESHGDKYDYTLVEYKNLTTKVRVICPDGGIFEILPQNHYRGYGCTCCSEHRSKGEETIQNELLSTGVEFLSQHTFDGCKHHHKLRFDFYLPEYNVCIEYDGIQHYKPIKWFGGESGFTQTKIRDEIKNNYCLENNIHLYRIKYNDDVISKLQQIMEDIKNGNGV